MVIMAVLKGMLAITKYAQRSESTIISWINQLDFPAKKISGAIWESDTELITEWRKKQIQTATVKAPAAKIKRKKGFK